jgi:hypothetical protein
MNKKKLNIDDLLSALKNPDAIDENIKADLPSLANTADTWTRIGQKDSTLATDIGIEESELNDFLKEWVEDNPYNAIVG